jgi:hypothetical protein
MLLWPLGRVREALPQIMWTLPASLIQELKNMINKIQAACGDMSIEFYSLSDKRIGLMRIRKPSLKS